MKMWQYTDCHLLDGISNAAGSDMNLCFFDYPSIIGSGGVRSITVHDITPTEATFKIEAGSSFASYKWYYTIKALSTSELRDKVSFSMDSAKADIKIPDLAPNSAYSLEILAESSAQTITFPSLTFTTKQAFPLPAENVQLNFNKKELFFSIPDFSASLASRRAGYRISILVNMQEVSHKEEAIAEDNFNKIIKKDISDMILSAEFKQNDLLQASILTYILDSSGHKIFSELGATYSKPIYIRAPLPEVDKVFIKVKNTYYRALGCITKKI
jgi:hypothetical protein